MKLGYIKLVRESIITKSAAKLVIKGSRTFPDRKPLKIRSMIETPVPFYSNSLTCFTYT